MADAVRNLLLRIQGDSTDAETSLEDIARRLQDFADEDPTAHADVDTAAADDALDRLEADLAAIDGRNVRSTVAVDVDEGPLDRLNTALRNTTTQTGRFQAAVDLVRMPALITGAGLAAQAVGALGAAGAGLGAALAPLGAGALAARASGLLALRSSTGVLQLGLLGVEDALSTAIDAFNKPTPAAQRFADVIERNVIPQVAGLRDAAQRNLLPGLADAMRTAAPALSNLRPIVANLSGTLAGLAQNAATAFSSAAWQRDIQTVGEANTEVVQSLGDAGLHLADVFRDVFTSAQPLVVWMARLADSLSAELESAVGAARQSGQLAWFFDQARVAIERFVSIGRSLGTVLGVVFQAAIPFGQDLLAQLDDMAGRLATVATSAGGRRSIAQFFEAAREPMHEALGLVEDLAGAFGRLSTPGPVLTQTIEQLRELVPTFENVIASTTAAFGPALVETVGQMAELFLSLAGTSGPLTVFVQTLGLFAQGLNWLVQNVPGFRELVVLMAGFAGVSRAMRFANMITGAGQATGAVRGLAGALRAGTVQMYAQRAASVAAAAAQLVVRGATLAAAAAQRVLNLALLTNPFALIVAAVVVAAVLIITHWKQVKAALIAAWNAIKRAASATWNAIKTAIVAIWNAVKAAARTTWNAIRGAVTGAFTGVKAALVAVWNAIKGAARTAWNAIKGAVTAPFNAAVRGVKAAFAGVGRALSATWNAIKTAARTAWNAIKGAITGPITAALNAVRGVGRAFYTAGRNILRSLTNGIKSLVSAPINAVKGVIKKARDLLPFSEPRDHSSPLYGLRRSGQAIVDNLSAGIATAGPQLEAALRTPLAVQVPRAVAAPATAAASGGRSGTHIGQVVLPPPPSGTMDARAAAVMFAREMERRGT